MEGTLGWLCSPNRHVPLLHGSGEFGDVKNFKAANARYTSLSANRPLLGALFPREDMCLLPLVEVDGQEAEPHSFVPVLPLAVLEHLKGISEGWNCEFWARRFSDVFALVRAGVDATNPMHQVVLQGVKAVQTGQPLPVALEYGERRLPLRPSARGHKYQHLGRMVEVRGQLCHFGTYEVRTTPKGETEIRITELPMRVEADRYVARLLQTADKKPTALAEFVREVNNFSGGMRVDIQLLLRPGALELLKAKYESRAGEARGADSSDRLVDVEPGDESDDDFDDEDCDDEDLTSTPPSGDADGPGPDPIECALKLFVRMRSALRVVKPRHKGLVDFGADYHSLVLSWFPVRAKYYRLRLDRRLALAQLRLRVERETLRYFELRAPGQPLAGLSKLKNAAAAAVPLRAEHFPAVNSGLLRSPGHTPTADLEALCIGDPDGDSDDDSASKRTFKYLLDLRERDHLQDAVAKRAAKVADLEREIALVNELLAEQPFAGASLWLAELDQCEKVLRDQGAWD